MEKEIRVLTTEAQVMEIELNKLRNATEKLEKMELEMHQLWKERTAKDAELDVLRKEVAERVESAEVQAVLQVPPSMGSARDSMAAM